MADVTGTFYPNNDAIHGYGAQLLIGDNASPEGFDAVAAILKITPGEMSTENIFRTHLRSPDAHQEKMPGIRDSGPFTVEGTWLPRHESQSNAGGGSGSFTAGGLMGLWRTRAIRNMKISLNDSPATQWPFRAYVSRFQPGEIGIDSQINFTAELTPLEDYSADLP